MSEDKTILITGGAGYVGGYLTDLLREKGYEVTIYDNLVYESRYLKNASFIYGDVRDHERLGSIINNFDIVIWLAALVGDAACAVNPTLTFEINTKPVEWLAKNYHGKIIFMSTASVYGINDDLLDEDAKLNPISVYAESKLKAEQGVVAHSKDYLIFRLATLFGLGDRYSRPRMDLVVNALTKQAILLGNLNVFGGGQWRPLLHVKDVAEAVLFGIEQNLQGIFNINYKNFRICDIAEEVKKIIPHTRISYSNIRFEDLRNYKVSSEKLRSYGWRPKYDLPFGIKEFSQILEEHRMREPNDINYSNAQFIKSRII